MMSQNRQSQLDRMQNDFVGMAMLRNEHQTRHVDAKLDHLINYQWKRLLEIQDIQTQLLYTHLGSNSSIKANLVNQEQQIWTAEINSDELTRMLIRYYKSKQTPQDGFIFSHWHQVRVH